MRWITLIAALWASSAIADASRITPSKEACIEVARLASGQGDALNVLSSWAELGGPMTGRSREPSSYGFVRYELLGREATALCIFMWPKVPGTKDLRLGPFLAMGLVDGETISDQLRDRINEILANPYSLN